MYKWRDVDSSERKEVERMYEEHRALIPELNKPEYRWKELDDNLKERYYNFNVKVRQPRKKISKESYSFDKEVKQAIINEYKQADGAFGIISQLGRKYNRHPMTIRNMLKREGVHKPTR